MSNRLRTMLLLAGIWATSTQADTPLGMTVGVDVWGMKSSGAIADNSNRQPFDHGSDTLPSFSFGLKHSMPLIPNFRLRAANMSISDRATLDVNLVFDDVTYTAHTSLGTEFHLQSNDFIFYYELFNDDLVTLDLGLNGKYVDGDIRVGDSPYQTKVDFNVLAPMLYGAIKYEIPTTRFSVFGDFNMLNAGKYALHDYQTGAAYRVEDSMAGDFKVRGGYRKFGLELDERHSIHGDWSFDGLFLGIEADF